MVHEEITDSGSFFGIALFIFPVRIIVSKHVDANEAKLPVIAASSCSLSVLIH
jgi:hypothetical protein